MLHDRTENRVFSGSALQFHSAWQHVKRNRVASVARLGGLAGPIDEPDPSVRVSASFASYAATGLTPDDGGLMPA